MNTDLILKNISKHITLDKKEEGLFISILHFKKLKRKEFLLKEGQICNHIYFVESGCLKTFYNKDGKEINLNFTLENNFKTNLKSLRTATPSDNFIQAIEPTLIWEFDKQSLFNLYAQSTEITSFGRSLLEQLLCEQEEHSNIFKLQTPKERYRYLEKNNPELLQRVSLSQLSTYLGVSRETLSRIRKQ